MSTTGSHLTLALGVLVALGTLRGGAITLSKFVSLSGVPPFGYVFWQCGIAAALLLGVRLAQGRGLRGHGGYLRYYAVCGLVGGTLPNALFFFVVKSVPAGTMAVVLTTVPLITYAFALLLRMERADLLRAMGIVLGFGGAALILWPGGLGIARIDAMLLLGFLCPLGYALSGIYAGRAGLQYADPILLAGGTMLVASLSALPIALASGQFHPLWQDPGLAELLIGVHGLLAAASYSLFFLLVKLAGPVYYSQSSYVVALMGIAWGMLVYGEAHEVLFWAAVALIFAGIALVNRRQHAAMATRRS